MKMNFGCGPDIKEGWVNVDKITSDGIEYWDIVENVVPINWINKFDFILVNHTFCLLSYDDVDMALQKIKSMLKPSGVLEVIDVDVMKAFQCYQKFDFEGLFVDGTTPEAHERDERLCKHFVGFGRKSIYTAYSMAEKLEKAGFKDVLMLDKSEYDFRPKESLVVRGTK